MQRTLSLLRQSAIGTTLRAQSKLIERNEISSSAIQQLCQNLLATHIQSGGVGLAAPQIGSNLSVIVVNLSSMSNLPLLLINPRIKHFSLRRDYDYEGCLSIPGFIARVRRSLAADVEYLDVNGILQSKKFGGFDARVLQHEVDHLNGKLIIDHIRDGREEQDFLIHEE